MKVVFPYSLRDQEQAVRLAEWIKELGGCENHSVLVVRDHRANPEAGEVLKTAGFDKWKEIVIRDDAYDHWPESCNLMFRRAAKQIEYGSKEAFLWLEPDIAPLKAGWLDAIEAEYKEAVARGKHFLGDFVHVPEMMNVPDHCSGVAVYPGVLSHFAGTAYLAHETAWDVVAAGQIVPQMHKSKLIMHAWKHPKFESWEQVEQRIFAVKPEAVLFHASKDGSLIELLRKRKMNLSGGVESEGCSSRDTHGDTTGKASGIQSADHSPIASVVTSGSSAPPAQNFVTEQNAESCSTSGPVVKLEPDADAEIQRLAEQLKGFMGNSVMTRRVRNVLHEVGVIQLPYRFRKRKGWKRRKAKA